MKNIIVLFILSLFVLNSCTTEAPTKAIEEKNKGQILFSINKSNTPSEVTKIIITLKRDEHFDIVKKINIEDTDNAQVLFENINSGVWKVYVEAINDEQVVLYFGETEANVTPGIIVPINLQLNASPGGIKINITWGKSLLDNVVAFYPFIGDANDHSGNELNGSVHGPILTFDRFGNSQSAFYFDGVNDFIQVDKDEKLQIEGNLTISLWFKSDSFEGVSESLIRFQADNTDNYQTNALYCLSFNYGSNKLTYAHENGNGIDNSHTFHNFEFDVERWYNIVIVRNMDQKHVKLYVDGDLADIIEYSENPDLGRLSYLRIGENHGTIQTERFFHGSIDDIIILDRTVSTNEIEMFYNLTKYSDGSPSNNNLFIAHMPFENNGNDISSYKNHANIYGGEIKQGIIGNAIYLDGVNDYVSISHQQHLNNSQKTIMFWMYKENDFIRDTPGLSDVEGIVMKSWDTGWDRDFSFAISNQEPPFDIYLKAGNKRNQLLEVRAPNKIEHQKWYHIVGMIDKNYLKLFINGVFITETNFEGEINYNESPVIIGKASVDSFPTRFFNGKIDEFIILNKTLSLAEIKSYYSNGK